MGGTDEAKGEAKGEAKDETKDETKEDEKEGAEGEAKAAKKKKAPEPTSFALANPSRVTPEQEQHVSFNLEQRYVPVNPRSKPAGIVVLIDRTPDEPEEVVQVTSCAPSPLLCFRSPGAITVAMCRLVQVELPASDAEKDEASPPGPFEWSPDMQ